MTLPASGSISLSQVNVELGLSSTAQISLNDAAVRALFGVASGAIDMQDGYGKSSQFAFSIASNQTNANLATLATAAGWNGTSKLVATINSGIYCSSNSTGTPAMTVSGSFPGGVELVNNGYIIGMGGNGGAGRSASGDAKFGFVGSGGSAGGTGGTALSTSVAMSVTNNGTIGGGGGGGGGGRAGYDSGDNVWKLGGGGGGGGRSSLAANSSGGGGGSASGNGQNSSGSSGGAGTSSSQGGGGSGGFLSPRNGGVGGSGGGWGSSGSTGGAGSVIINLGGPFSGGAGGAAVSGNSNITWLATGTRLGAIT